LAAVAVALAVATLLIAGAHDETRRALRDAETQRAAALRNAEEAEEARKRAVSHSFMILHGVTEPLKRLGNPDLERQPELAAMRRRALSEAALGYELFVDSRGDDADETTEAVNSLIHLGLIHTIAGDREEAMATYRRAIARGDAWLASNPADTGVCDSVGMAHFNLGMDLRKLGRPDEAEGQFRASDARFMQGLEIAPDDFGLRQHLSWLLAFCPEDRLRPPSRAVAEVRRLVELTEGKGRDRASFSQGIRPKFTEGLALYRAGDWSAAREALEESCRRREGGDAYEWFVLSMALARLGDLDAARREYDRAVEWTKWNRYGDTELHILEAEAATLLGRSPGFQ
jgi:tetratricopeptide (TPR) repeat protein